MSRLRLVPFLSALALSLGANASAQQAEDRTLLDATRMRAIINEASGERAMHHVLEMVPYPRVRPLAEYQGHFRETAVMARLAREYGFSDVEIVSYPTGRRLWQPTRGELWMVEPELRKLADIHDVAVSLAGNSTTGDVTAELVDVGAGTRAEDYEGKDVRGRIVLGRTRAGTLQQMGMNQRGAIGVLSTSVLRADDYPNQISSQSISAAEGSAAFGWSISPRMARELSGMLARGEKVVLRSIVESQTFPGELEMVHAVIPGDGSTDQDVMISAHLYEGYIKQGANDDNSGCAVTLEMGRAYLRLIAEGKLPRPKRTVHFLWVPEISGTNAWLNANPDVEQRIIADLNFDMEGIGLAMSGSFWVLHRTPDTFPSFINDVAQSFLEFVGNTNRERIRFRSVGYDFTLPVVSPNGTRDPFYYAVEKYYGASDHATFLQHGIPAIMFITWPDLWYHSSQDTPDKLDPTQFKRVAVVGIGAMSTLASADDVMALRVAHESLGRGAERTAAAQRKGLAWMADVADGARLAQAYKDARIAVQHQAAIEKEVIRSVAVLFADQADGRRRLSQLEPAIAGRAEALEEEIEAAYRLAAAQWNVNPGEPALSDLEREAARLVVERAQGGGGTVTAADRAAAQAAQARIPGHMRSELNVLLGTGRTALEIRNFLSGEFEPLPLEDFMAWLRAQERMGAILTTRRTP